MFIVIALIIEAVAFHLICCFIIICIYRQKTKQIGKSSKGKRINRQSEWDEIQLIVINMPGRSVNPIIIALCDRKYFCGVELLVELR